MQRVFSSFFSPLSLIALGCLIPSTAKAQVTPDGTTSTSVNQEGNNFTIEQGDRAGNNLFHSFDEFSVPTQGSAVFNNAGDIANIFSRVTGSNISNIDGLLGANGTANLYLINPNGIIFGRNARLDLGGSFFASTADSLLFDSGEEFSASNPQAAPLLEVSIPIGASFRDNPGDIVNRSIFQNSAGEFIGLEIDSGNSLTFIGGNISFETGVTTAKEGNINLGSLSQVGTVSINKNDSLNFSENVAQGNISLNNVSALNATGSGNISINARNLSLLAGNFGGSFILKGISSESTSAEVDSGDVTINVTDKIILNNSFISNQADAEISGNSGNIVINTGSLELTNGSQIDSSTFGQGNAGSIDIAAAGDITIDGNNSEGILSSISSQVKTSAVGNAGEITILTTDLSLTNGGGVDVSTRGQGNAGAINITATGDIAVDGKAETSFLSNITSRVGIGGVGDSGGITISTTNFSLTNGGEVDASTNSQGNAGAINITASGDITIDGGTDADFNSANFSSITSGVDIGAEGDSGGVTISTTNLNLTDGGLINATTLGQGNAGAINITATEDITVTSFPSSIGNFIGSEAEGDSGGVTISTTNLNLIAGGRVTANTLGQGNAGAVNITASGNIIANGVTESGLPSGISSDVRTQASGDSGGVTISTNNLDLTKGGRVTANTLGQGNAGAIDITALGDITADGELSGSFPSGITSVVNTDAEGDAGGVNISTTNLNLINGGIITTSTLGRGDAGAIDITALGDITVDGELSGDSSSSIRSGVNSSAEGDAGGVTISTTNLNLTNGARVDAGTLGQGNAGAIDITALGDITAEGENNDSFLSGIASQVNTDAEGDAGGVTISTTNLNLTNGARVDASTFGRGNAGAINIIALGDIAAEGESNDGFPSGIASQVNTNAEGDAGGVNISTTDLNLTRGGQVAAFTAGRGDASNVIINASGSIFIDGSINRFRSGISANAINQDGNGGDIFVSASKLSIENGGTIEATNFDTTELSSLPGIGRPGNITIVTDSIELTDNARIETVTQFGEGESANIDLQVAEDIRLNKKSFISARAEENANGGNLTINADDGFILASTSNGDNDIVARAEQGNGGQIEIFTQALFGLEERPATSNNGTNDIDASSEFGLQGDFSLSTPDFDPTSGLINLPASVGDASDQISQNPCEQGVGSEFKITGKGGLPPTVNEALNSEETDVELIEAVSSQQQTENDNISSDNPTSEAVPAMGWIFNDRGEVTLTTYSTSDAEIKRSSRQTSSTCSASSFQNR